MELRTILSRDPSGQAKAMWAIVRDITERKRIEEKLRQSHAELEVKVKERTAELRLSNKALMEHALKLEKLNRELEDFAFIACHDLQEPLRKIRTFGSILLQKQQHRLDDEGRGHLVRITKSAKRISDSIHSLFDYSQISSDLLRFEPVDLGEAARDVVVQMGIVIKEVDGKVEINDLPTIEADFAQVRRLLQNLIDNAIKYRKEHESPVVKISCEMEYDTCTLIFEDNGIGFDVKYLDLIFKPFQQLHSRGKYDGTGMGLALCRKIVECHEGSITAWSAVGQGSTFIVRLPCTQRN